jgi:sodium transport system permease protein
MLGMMVVTTPGLEFEGPLLLLPVVNTAFMIRELFLGHGTAQQIAFVFFSTCLYAAGTVVLAARVFAREEVLFSAQGSLRLFLKRRFFQPSATPKPGDALLVAALLFPINFYFQLWLAKAMVDPAAGLQPAQFAVLVMVPQYLLFLSLPLAVAWYLKVNLRSTFQWRTPPAGSLLGALCLGSSSWLIAQQLVSWQSHFWTYSPGDMATLEKALESLSASAAGKVALIFLIGVTPALCEEHLFRGFVMQGMRGVIFGAYHFPFFKQPVVMLLGMALAYVAWQARSIWPAVLFHFLHNSMSAVGAEPLGLSEGPAVPGQPLPGVPPRLLLPAVALFAFGLWLVKRVRCDDEPVAS